MPPTGYLTGAGIESCLQYLATTYPSICQLIVLPEMSVEGRTIRAIKIASGAGTDRHGVLLIGGVHAREIVNPDLLVSFALNLCRAYTSNSGLVFGGKSYDASTIQLIVNALDVFIFPLVNPDGRVYIQSPSGDPMWRKNRSPNSGLPCMGVDLNRNYDFLWSSTIGVTSSNSCSDVFHGSSAFSEPETRNVRHMLDTYPNIACMMDVHSYMQLVLHSWGDDDNQITDPSMSFMNPIYNGLRGTMGDTLYKEYIPQADLDWLVNTGNQVRDAIAAARGRVYTVEQAALLYPTSGTSKDYAFSRHFVDASKRKVYAYTLETGLEFQPPYSEALNIISEVSAGLIQFCLRCLCVVEETVRGTTLVDELEDMRAFRDREILRTPAGRRYVQLLEANSLEILEIVMRDERLRKQVVDVLRRVHAVVRTRKDPKPKVFDAEVIAAAEQLAAKFSDKGSPALKKTIKAVRNDLAKFRGKAVLEGLKLASGTEVKRQRRK